MKKTICHHCDKLIIWNRHWTGNKYKGGHWSHAILVFNGRAVSPENALMEQRCSNGINWATPKRIR